MQCEALFNQTHGENSAHLSTTIGLDDVLFKKDFIYLFSERGNGSEKERERNIDVTEKYQSIAFHMHPNWGPSLLGN